MERKVKVKGAGVSRSRLPGRWGVWQMAPVRACVRVRARVGCGVWGGAMFAIDVGGWEVVGGGGEREREGRKEGGREGEGEGGLFACGCGVWPEGGDGTRDPQIPPSSPSPFPLFLCAREGPS